MKQRFHPRPVKTPITVRARGMHERTGEIEVLISGALLFGLIQVPGYLSHAFDVLVPTLNSTRCSGANPIRSTLSREPKRQVQVIRGSHVA